MQTPLLRWHLRAKRAAGGTVQHLQFSSERQMLLLRMNAPGRPAKVRAAFCVPSEDAWLRCRRAVQNHGALWSEENRC
jgi:hypothetical protein